MSRRIRVYYVETYHPFLVFTGHFEHAKQELGSDAVTPAVGPHDESVHEQLISLGPAVEQGRPGDPARCTPESELLDDVPSPDRGQSPTVEMKAGQSDQLALLDCSDRPSWIQASFDQFHAALTGPDSFLEFQAKGVPVEVGGSGVMLKTKPERDLEWGG